MDDRALKSLEKEISKDISDIEKQKISYANQVRNGLGKDINNINSYIKKEPSKYQKLKNFISKVFKYI